MFKLVKNRYGFTLAEILTVVFIFLIITTAVLANFRQGEHNSQFLLATEQLASDLKEMQNRTLSGIIDEEITATGGYGIYFSLISASEYVLFRDDGDQLFDPDAADVILRTVELPENITLVSLTSDPLTIVFKPPKPTAYINGALSADLVKIDLNSSEVEDKTGEVSFNRITGRATANLMDK